MARPKDVTASSAEEEASAQAAPEASAKAHERRDTGAVPPPDPAKQSAYPLRDTGAWPTGRGTEEYTGARCDILVGTLGKAFGVNGGYVTSDAEVIRFLRETSPMYIYSNPITVGEAAAALKSIDLLDSAGGRERLKRLRALTQRFEDGIVAAGFETIPGEHPVVPLMVRDTTRTRALIRHLRDNGVLATGLTYPVVPRGDEEIRFQVNADHTEADVDFVIGVLKEFGN